MTWLSCQSFSSRDAVLTCFWLFFFLTNGHMIVSVGTCWFWMTATKLSWEGEVSAKQSNNFVPRSPCWLRGKFSSLWPVMLICIRAWLCFFFGLGLFAKKEQCAHFLFLFFRFFFTAHHKIFVFSLQTNIILVVAHTNAALHIWMCENDNHTSRKQPGVFLDWR